MEASPIQNMVPVQNHQERKLDWPARSWMHFCSTLNWGAGRVLRSPWPTPSLAGLRLPAMIMRTGGRVLRRGGHGDGVRA